MSTKSLSATAEKKGRESTPPSVSSKDSVLAPVSRASALAASIRSHMKDVESIQMVGKDSIPKVQSISTGSLGLDVAIGVGGLPYGRIVEIFGPESSGKTTIALQALAACQQKGGVGSFVDAEHAIDFTYAQNLGVNTGEMLLSQPDNGEQALSIVELLVSGGRPGDLVVVDSVAALVPKAEIEGEMGDSHMGLQARMMGQALRKITAIAAGNGVIVIFINQLRQKIGVMFGNPETTPGGNALKFWATIRLDVRRISQNKVGDEVVSNRTKVKVIKNKIAPPFKIAEFDIKFGTGVDYRAEILEYGAKFGIIQQTGSWYSYQDERIANGQAAAVAALAANPELEQKIYKAVRERAFPAVV